MNTSNSLPRTFRLRNLVTVKCRNIQLNLDDVRSESGLFFAINSVGHEDIGYTYVSPVSKCIKNPEWNLIDLTGSSQQMNSAKAAVFTFFVKHDHSNSVLFEMKVHFSGLVPINHEKHFTHEDCESFNEVYFQFHGIFYASPEYLSFQQCSQCLLSRSQTSAVFKPSYSLECLEQLLVIDQIFQAQVCEIEEAGKSLRILEECLAPLFEHDAEREEAQTQLELVKNRIKIEENKCALIRLRRDQVAKQLTLIEQRMKDTAQANSLLQTRAEQFAQAVISRKHRLAKLSEALSLRTAVLVSELLDVFGPDLARYNPLPESITLLKLRLNNSPLIEARSDSAENPTPAQHPSTGPLQDSQPGLYTVEPDAASAAITLGAVALLLRLLAAVLNIPLRHPLDLNEGVSKARIVDSFTSTDSTENGQSFPLYLPRSSVVPAYKHAVFLLNQNLSALRAICDMPKASEEPTLWNFLTLLQHCVLHRSQLRLV